MSYDFKAQQLRVNKIINSSSAGGNAPLLVYGDGSATDEIGGINGSHFAGTGSDVWMFISGTRGGADSAGSYGVVAFKGDVVVSGALQLGEALAPGTPASGKGALYVKSSDSLPYFKNDLGAEYNLTSATPAGSDTQVQFNDGGVLAGDSGLTFNKTTDRLTVSHVSASTITASFISPSSPLVIRPQSSTTTAGSDAFFFVSGSENSNFSVFGGRVVVTGSITGSAISGSGLSQFGSDVKIAGNITGDNTSARGIFTDVVDITIGGAASTIVIGGDIKVNGNDIKSSTGATVIAFTGSSVTIPGDLNVLGTTTTISSSNLLIKDPVIVLASGSAGYDTNGGIAIFSGSKDGTKGNDLVFGRVDSDTWGAGTLSTNNGNVTTLDAMNLGPIRALEFQVSSSAESLNTTATALILSASTSKGIRLQHGGVPNNNVIFKEHAAEYIRFNRDSIASPNRAVISPGTGYDLQLSGATVIVMGGPASSTPPLQIWSGGASPTPFMQFNSSSVGAVITANNLKKLRLESSDQIQLSGSEIAVTGLVTGSIAKFNQITGSLTKLATGEDYLIAGANITLTTGALGNVTITSTAGGGTPGGSNTQIQFNADGTFGGVSNLTFSTSSNTLALNGYLDTQPIDARWYLNNNSADALSFWDGSGGSRRFQVNMGDGVERFIAYDNAGFAAGDGSDLVILHNGTDSSIKNSTGQLVISGANGLFLTGTIRSKDPIISSEFTGSLTKLAGGQDYLVAGANVTLTTGALGQVTIAATSSPAGANTQVQFNDNNSFGAKSTFTFATGSDRLTVLHVSASTITASFISPASPLVIRPQNSSTDAGSDVFLFVSGSSTDLSVFGGDVTASGSLRLKDTSAITNVQLQPNGQISGSSTLSVGGNATVAGRLTVAANQITGSAGGNLTLGPSGKVTVAGNLEVDGNNILASDGTTSITLAASTGNVTLPADLAVNGGDLTTSAVTFNLVTGSATTVNFAQTATNVVMGATTGTSTIRNTTLTLQNATAVNLSSTSPASITHTSAVGQSFSIISTNGNIVVDSNATGSITVGQSIASNTIAIGSANTATGATQTINIGAGTPVGTGKATITIGNTAAGGTTTINSPNVTLAGDLAVNGGDLTTNQATFNLVNSTATTVNMGGGAATINFGSPTSTGSMQGELSVAARTVMGTTLERMINSGSSNATTNFDMLNQSIFFQKAPLGNLTANFINVPTTSERVVTPTIIVSQSSPNAYIVNGLQINGSAISIHWPNAVPPTGTPNRFDVFGFSLIRSGSTWFALGQMTTYGA